MVQDELLVLEKIDNAEELSSRDMLDILDLYTVSVEEGETLRWTKDMRSIIQLKNRYFCIEWQQGLTEYQEDIFDKQPYEVKKVEKMIKVCEWHKITKN